LPELNERLNVNSGAAQGQSQTRALFAGITLCEAWALGETVATMNGTALLALILLSMAWLLFVFGAALNLRTWRAARRAKQGELVPAGIPFLPGAVGSLAAFFSVSALIKFGHDVPWPWLWVLLPLFLDAYGLGGIVLALLGFARRGADGKAD